MASTIDALTLLNQASKELGDVAKAHWDHDELFGYLNDAQRDLCIIRPDAYVKNAATQLVAGIKQSLPSDGYALIDITHNKGPLGTSDGKPINRVDIEIMRRRLPSWTTTKAGSVAKHYVVNASDPTHFDIYPPQPAVPSYVQLIYFATPPNIANYTAGTKIVLDDMFANALYDYILYRAFGKDSEYGNQIARSNGHYEKFALGAEFGGNTGQTQ